MLSNLVKGANSSLNVAVFGGHGFIGRYLLNDLGKEKTFIFCSVV
jgi:nucleoside-diphosphate-sugar epimerase